MSESETPQRFSLRKRSIPIELEDEGGQVHVYTLKEPDGTGRDQILDKMNERAKVSKDGSPAGIKSFKGLHADLISKVLYDVDDKPVSANVIQGWPASLQEKLFKMAQDLAGLGGKAEEEAKND
jgi:hypothetical protein